MEGRREGEKDRKGKERKKRMKNQESEKAKV
jgi:hypothetical protein